MNKEAQRIAIAEACGAIWRDAKGGRILAFKKDPTPDDGYPHPGMAAPERIFSQSHPVILDVPDYPNSLDAMHEAEKGLLAKDLPFYAEELTRLLWVDCQKRQSMPIAAIYEWHATASQRAEAFLRTLGKWQD